MEKSFSIKVVRNVIETKIIRQNQMTINGLDASFQNIDQ